MGRWFLPAERLKSFGGFVTDPVQGLGIPFMLAGPILTVVCIGIYLVTSWWTPAMDEAQVAKVCWDHPLAFLRGPITAVSDPRVISALLLVTVSVCYYILR
jgi:solute:Na+ symporter, SSS family